MSQPQTQSKLLFLGSGLILLGGLIWALLHYFAPQDADAKMVTPAKTVATSTSATASVPMNMPSAANVSTATQVQPAKNTPLSLEQRLALINQRNPNLNMNSSQLQALMNKPNAWQVQDDIVNQLQDKLEPHEVNDGRKFIAIDPMKIETLLPNDTMQVEIPQLHKAFTLKVDDMSSENGITSWTGKLTDFPDLNTVIITQGGTGNSLITQIGLNTPTGFYVAEGFNKAGWIVSGGTKFSKGEIVVPMDSTGNTQTPEVYPGADNKPTNDTNH